MPHIPSFASSFSSILGQLRFPEPSVLIAAGTPVIAQILPHIYPAIFFPGVNVKVLSSILTTVQQ